MIRGLSDITLGRKSSQTPPETSVADGARSGMIDYSVGSTSRPCDDIAPRLRRTPKVSLVVVVPENHVVSPDSLLDGLRSCGDQEVDVLVACAGQPSNLGALQRCVGDAQFLLAPAGTSLEDLREMAMAQAPGDIVTLLRGALLRDVGVADQQLFKTS